MDQKFKIERVIIDLEFEVSLLILFGMEGIFLVAIQQEATGRNWEQTDHSHHIHFE